MPQATPKQEADKDENLEQDQVIQETPEQALAAQKEGFVEAETSTPTPVESVKKTDDEIAQEEADAKKATEEAEAKEAAEAARLAEENADKPVIAGFSERQIKEIFGKVSKIDALGKQLDKVSGKFGSVEATLKEIATAKGAGVQLSKEDIAELEAEYGPELSTALLGVFNKFGAKIGKLSKDAESGDTSNDDVKAQIDAATKATATEVRQELAAAKQATELRLLSRDHKDWRSIVQGEPLLNADGTPQVDAQGNKIMGLKPDFAAWVDKLPADEKTRLLTAWDADFLSEKISAYKESIKAEADKSAAEAAAAKAKAEAEAKKQSGPSKRLSSSVPAKSVPGTVTTKTVLDEQREGYASV
jgi:hypothetical protein